MEHHILEFYPPIIGLENEFNTVRVGQTWAKKLIVGDTVYLSDNKEKKVIGMALVTKIEKGTLEEICQAHAHMNHTLINSAVADKPQELLRIVQRFYGPQIATPTKKSVVIYCKRIPCSS